MQYICSSNDLNSHCNLFSQCSPRGSEVFAEEKMYKVITVSKSLARKLEKLLKELRERNKDIRDYCDVVEFLVEFYEEHKSK